MSHSPTSSSSVAMMVLKLTLEVQDMPHGLGLHLNSGASTFTSRGQIPREGLIAYPGKSLKLALCLTPTLTPRRRLP